MMHRSSSINGLLRAVTYMIQGFHTVGPAMVLRAMWDERMAGLEVANLGNRSVVIALGAACFVYVAHMRAHHFTPARRDYND